MYKMKSRIPVCSPEIREKEVEYVAQCVRSGWISSIGECVTAFEEKFARYCGCKFGVATNSGTSALHLALASLDLKRGDEVIIPTFTMIATPNAVTYTGAKPVLVDAEPDTWNMDVSELEEKISRRTKAIIPVHTYGHPVDMNPLLEIAKEHDLYVIEDAAEAHGAEYFGKRTGGLGDIGCFSFYANKIITTGEGGMLVTDNREVAEKAKWLEAHAFGRHGRHFYHEALGFNYRMSALQASLGLAQLERIDEFVSRRRSNAKLYNSLLSSLEHRVTLPPEASWAKNVYWMYSILIEEGFGLSRNELMEKLGQQGIETRTFFYPIHVQPIYAALFDPIGYPVAASLSEKGVNLPSGNSLTPSEIEQVCECIMELAKPTKEVQTT